MRKLFICVFVCTLCACTTKWEYKVVSQSPVTVTDNNSSSDYYPNGFGDPSSLLNDQGKEGWELVTSYTVVGTTFPNFGDNQYVTGMKSNTKTKEVYFVFKRPMTGNK